MFLNATEIEAAILSSDGPEFEDIQYAKDEEAGVSIATRFLDEHGAELGRRLTFIKSDVRNVVRKIRAAGE